MIVDGRLIVHCTVYDNIEIGKEIDPKLITPLERIHDGHKDKECRPRAYMIRYLPR